MPTTLDPSKILPGWAGKLYDTSGNFLAEVPQWHIALNFQNSEYRAAGQPQTYAIPQNYSATLVLTETVIQDADLLKPLLDDLQNGKVHTFAFQGKLIPPNGGTGATYTCYTCIPDGTIDVANVTQGDVLQRAWSFRVNAPPKPDSYLSQ